uniref:Uncharacterized protein n=1 Tax=Oryza meridionalis TaxID=40149 RepID=A0A0E0CFK2_9ORYZ
MRKAARLARVLAAAVSAPAGRRSIVAPVQGGRLRRRRFVRCLLSSCAAPSPSSERCSRCVRRDRSHRSFKPPFEVCREPVDRKDGVSVVRNGSIIYRGDASFPAHDENRRDFVSYLTD